MIVYKFDIVEQLRESGYTTTKLRKEKILSEGTLTKFRTGDTNISIDNLERLCKLLDMQPGNILKYIED